jgi:hypothetical protein
MTLGQWGCRGTSRWSVVGASAQPPGTGKRSREAKGKHAVHGRGVRRPTARGRAHAGPACWGYGHHRARRPTRTAPSWVTIASAGCSRGVGAETDPTAQLAFNKTPRLECTPDGKRTPAGGRDDQLFADLYPAAGRPVKVAPWRLALVVVMQYDEIEGACRTAAAGRAGALLVRFGDRGQSKIED